MNSDFTGFSKIIEVDAKTRDCLFEDVEIDMAGVRWFDANMCAPFGAILYRMSRDLNNGRLINLSPGIRKILSKNGFLSSYGGEKRAGTYGATIEYNRFETKDDRDFASYVEHHLVGKDLSPKLDDSRAA